VSGVAVAGAAGAAAAAEELAADADGDAGCDLQPKNARRSDRISIFFI